MFAWPLQGLYRNYQASFFAGFCVNSSFQIGICGEALFR